MNYLRAETTLETIEIETTKAKKTTVTATTTQTPKYMPPKKTPCKNRICKCPCKDTDQNFLEIVQKEKTCISPDGKTHKIRSHDFDSSICPTSNFTFYVSGIENGNNLKENQSLIYTNNLKKVKIMVFLQNTTGATPWMLLLNV